MNAQSPATPRHHIRFMDGLRGLAVLMVVLYHGYEQGLLGTTVAIPGFTFELPSPLFRAGGNGVEIFYFISGFVLIYPLAQHVFEGRARQTLREYVGRRALKIVPSYVLALVTLTLCIPLEVPANQSLLSHFLAHLFFLHAFRPETFASIDGPLWTLAIEVQFYLIFPLIAYAFERRPRLTLAGMVALSIAYRIAVDVTGTGRTFMWSDQLPDFLDLFGFGMYASWIVVQYRERERGDTEQRRWTLVALIAFALIYGYLGQAMQTGGPDAWKWSNDHRDLFAVLLFALCVATAFGHASWRALLSNRLLVFLSVISYNLYLWNKNLFVWYKQHWSGLTSQLPYGAGGNVVGALVALAIPIAVATAVTYVFERPLLRAGWPGLWRPTLAAVRRLPARFVPARGAALDVVGTPAAQPLPAVASALAFLLPLALYLASMRHVPGAPNGAELVTVSYVFGIAHPTGYPGFVVCGWLLSHLVPLGSVAARVIGVSVVAGALAAWLLARTIRALGGDVWIATVSALVFATGDVVWSRATDANVQPLALAFFAAAFTAIVAYARDGSATALVRAGLFIGLAATVQPVVLLMLPGIVLVVAAQDGAVLQPWRLVRDGVRLGIATAVGLLPYLLIPLRALTLAHTGGAPLRALGKPGGEPIWNYDDPTTFAAFARLVTAADYGRAAAWNAWTDGPGVMPHLFALGNVLASDAGVVTLLAALAGAALVVRHHWPLGVAMLSFAFVPSFTALGFHLGEDVDAYHTYALWIAAACLGIAVSAVVRLYGPAQMSGRRLCALALLAAGAVGAIYDNRIILERRSDTAQNALIDIVIATTPPDAIVIAPWSQAMPLAEAAYAESLLGRRTIDPSFIAEDIPYLPQWTKNRPVYALGVPRDFVAPHVHVEPVQSSQPAGASISLVRFDDSNTGRRR